MNNINYEIRKRLWNNKPRYGIPWFNKGWKAVILFTAFVFFMLQPMTGVKASDSGDFQVEVEYGYGGYNASNTALPVSLYITNNGPDFEGQIKLLTNLDSYDVVTAYGQDLIISSGSTRQVDFVITNLDNYSNVQVVLENTKGTAVYDEKKSVSVNYSDDVFIGILSDDFIGLNYFDRVGNLSAGNLAGRNFRIMNLAEEGISRLEGGLDMFSVIVVNNYNTSLLEEAQAEVLKAWVQKGGTLIIGTGSTYQKTLNMFQDEFLAGSVGSVELMPLNAAAGVGEDEEDDTDSEITGTENSGTENSDTENSGTENSDAENSDAENSGTENSDIENSDSVITDSVILNLNQLRITVEDSVEYSEFGMQVVKRGIGKVAVFSFDLSDELFSEWDYVYDVTEDFLAVLLADAVDINTVSSQLSYWALQSMISNVGDDNFPKIGGFVYSILLYIVLLPVLYIILKKTDKRHFIWLMIPVLSVMFSIIIYGMGGVTRQKEPFMNYASLLQLYEGGSVKELNLLSVTSPSNRNYSFHMPGDYRVSVISSRYGNYSTTDYTVMLQQNVQDTEVSVFKSQSYDRRYFGAERYTDSFGDIEIAFSYNLQGYEGSVTNHSEYVLTGAGLILPFGVITLDTIEPGETVDISSGKDPLTTYYSMNDAAYVLIPYDYNGLDSVNVNARRNMISSMGSYNMLPYSRTYFMAFAEEYVPEAMEVQTYETSGAVIIVREFDLWDEESGKTVLTDLNRLSIVAEGDFSEHYNYDTGGYNYCIISDEGELEYYFDDGFYPESITYSTDEYLYYKDYMNVSFYNVETGDYDLVFEDEAIFMELTSYISEDNSLRVKFHQTYPGNETYIPSFIVIGREEER